MRPEYPNAWGAEGEIEASIAERSRLLQSGPTPYSGIRAAFVAGPFPHPTATRAPSAGTVRSCADESAFGAESVRNWV